MIWLSPSLLTFGTRPDRLGTLCTGPCNVPYKVWCNLRLSIHVREDNKHFNMFIRRFIPTIAALLPSGTMNNSNSGSRNTWLLVAQYNKYASSAKSKRRSKDRQCWKCSAIISSAVEFFCPSCNIIQKPSKTATYFELLNSPKTFDINTTQLAEEYKKLQWKLHPDKFSELSKVFHDMWIARMVISKCWNSKLGSFSGH